MKPLTFLYILLYMLLTIPMSILSHQRGVEPMDLPLLYSTFALLKISLTLSYLRRLGIAPLESALILTFALLGRFLFGAPWMMLTIGAAIFLRAQRKILT